MPLYVYAIMRAPDARRAIGAAKGRQPLHVIEHESIGALVSPMPEGGLRMRRGSILSHAEVLQAAFEHGPILPMRLGTAMADEAAIETDLLCTQVDAFAARLDAVDGRAEMQVKAIYSEEPLMRSVLAQNPTLRRAVERSRSLPAAATHFEQIRIGEAIAVAVEERQASDGQALMAALTPLAVAVHLAPAHHERAVMNAAFLIDLEAAERFDRAVEQVSRERSPDIEFKLIGPMPAYSFADGEWNARETGKVSCAWA